MLVEILGLSVLGYVLWSLVAMEIRYRGAASALGVPLVRQVVDPNNLLWLVLEPHVWAVLDRLPVPWSSWPPILRYSRRGWHFFEKADAHRRYGPVWGLVTPCDVNLHFADADAAHDIFTRRGDFIRPSKMYKLLEVYGPCISTAEPVDWPRHRKVLAAPFNESIMQFVWDESVSQARGMLHFWTSAADVGIESVAKDTRTLSLNVLAATGFKRSYKFRGSNEPAADEAGSYRDALQTVLDNVIPLMLIPYRLLLLPMMPESWARVGRAGAAFKQHMAEMLDDEMSALNLGKEGSGGLMTSFMRALDVHAKEKETAKSQQGLEGSAKGLSVEEIFGNIMLLLAANPEVQDWVAEEVQQVNNIFRSDQGDYGETFQKLTRCRAVLLETLRLYPPIMALPKWTNDQHQKLEVGDRTLVIPPNTGITLSLPAIHTHPKYWSDPLRWRPSRWITTSTTTESTNHPTNPTEETLLAPPQLTFSPWSSGPQNCPGAKFSQVEFVAVLACLFKDLHHRRIGIVPKQAGESGGQARRRVLEVVDDVNMELLLRMREADRVRLRVC